MGCEITNIEFKIEWEIKRINLLEKEDEDTLKYFENWHEEILYIFKNNQFIERWILEKYEASISIEKKL